MSEPESEPDRFYAVRAWSRERERFVLLAWSAKIEDVRAAFQSIVAKPDEDHDRVELVQLDAFVRMVVYPHRTTIVRKPASA